jgi:sulfur-oxidizing protein SoxY
MTVSGIPRRPNRRQALRALSAGAALMLARPAAAESFPPETAAAIAKVTGGKPLRSGRVKLEIPQLVENGSAVSATIETLPGADGKRDCRSLHLFTEKNPQPEVVSFRFGPETALGWIDMQIRLADSQRVHAIAEFADGSWSIATVEIIVTIAACVEG